MAISIHIKLSSLNLKDRKICKTVTWFLYSVEFAFRFLFFCIKRKMDVLPENEDEWTSASSCIGLLFCRYEFLLFAAVMLWLSRFHSIFYINKLLQWYMYQYKSTVGHFIPLVWIQKLWVSFFISTFFFLLINTFRTMLWITINHLYSVILKH